MSHRYKVVAHRRLLRNKTRFNKLNGRKLFQTKKIMFQKYLSPKSNLSLTSTTMPSISSPTTPIRSSIASRLSAQNLILRTIMMIRRLRASVLQIKRVRPKLKSKLEPASHLSLAAASHIKYLEKGALVSSKL